jgi:acyl-CoA hydrolase
VAQRGASDDTEVVLAQVMLPGDANPQGDVHGGTIMKLVDTAGAIAAVRHARSRVVTAVIDQMTFEAPVHVGDLVELSARLTWTGRTSLEVQVTVIAERVLTGERRRANTAYLVYVALDEKGMPAPVPRFTPTDPEGRRLYAAAEARRAARLRAREEHPHSSS